LQHALASDFGILQRFILLVDGYISLLISGTSNIAIGLLTSKLLEINTKNTEAN
jgi:hypothetical protein